MEPDWPVRWTVLRVLHLPYALIGLYMSWKLDYTLIQVWLDGLDEASRFKVVAAGEALAMYGPQLGRPLVDTVKASRHKNMKELRPGSSGRSELRVLFAFDEHLEGLEQ